jgi:hypothetical protein
VGERQFVCWGGDDKIHSNINFFCFARAVSALLKYGADPNMKDEFSNVHLIAREKQLHSLHGILII